MICPKCQNNCGEEDSFCFRCGYNLSEPPVAPKGRHWVPIAILILLSALGIVLFFAIPMKPVQSDTPWFQVVDGTLYFDPFSYNGGPEVTVPEVVNGQTVTAIGQQAFENCTELTTVILPDTLLSIGDAAFSGCSELRGIFIPEGVTQIGKKAFANCSSLEAINLPASLATVGTGSFDNCGKLIYIFYNGSISHWKPLYTEHINPKTQVYCTDGIYQQP